MGLANVAVTRPLHKHALVFERPRGNAEKVRVALIGKIGEGHSGKDSRGLSTVSLRKITLEAMADVRTGHTRDAMPATSDVRRCAIIGRLTIRNFQIMGRCRRKVCSNVAQETPMAITYAAKI